MLRSSIVDSGLADHFLMVNETFSLVTFDMNDIEITGIPDAFGACCILVFSNMYEKFSEVSASTTGMAAWVAVVFRVWFDAAVTGVSMEASSDELLEELDAEEKVTLR